MSACTHVRPSNSQSKCCTESPVLAACKYCSCKQHACKLTDSFHESVEVVVSVGADVHHSQAEDVARAVRLQEPPYRVRGIPNRLHGTKEVQLEH